MKTHIASPENLRKPLCSVTFSDAFLATKEAAGRIRTDPGTCNCANCLRLVVPKTIADKYVAAVIRGDRETREQLLLEAD